jgi:uncharacterized membrane protein YphA (DoxX/SURF4 family)
LRLVAGIIVITRGLARLRIGPAIGPASLEALGIAVGMLLLAGLWTPVSGSLLAVLELGTIISERPPDSWADILLAAIGAALALLGPGAWSYDARLFGWRRIDVRDRRS